MDEVDEQDCRPPAGGPLIRGSEAVPVHRGLIAMSGSSGGMLGQTGRTPLFQSDAPAKILYLTTEFVLARTAGG